MSGLSLPPNATTPTADQLTEIRRRQEAAQAAEKDQRMMAVFRQAVTINPEARAEAESISKRLGKPVEALTDNIDVAREMLKVRELQETRRQYPNLDKRLDNLEFTSLVHDDLGNLKLTEDTFDWVKRNFRTGKFMNERGEIGARMMAGLSNSDDTLRLEQLKLLTQDAGQDTGFVASALQLSGQMIGPMAKSFAASTAAAGAVSLFSGPGATVTGPAAFTTTMLASTFAQTAVIEGGNAFLDMRDKGYGEDVSMFSAAFVGLANGALETVGLGIVLNPIRKAVIRRTANKLGQALARPTTKEAITTLAKDYFASVFGEAGQEGVQEFVNVIGEAFARDATDPNLPAPSWGEIGERVSDAFITTAKGMALLGLPAPAIRFHMDTRAAADAKEHQNFMLGLKKGAAESKLRQRNPSVYKDYLRKTAEGSPVEKLYLDGKVFSETLQQLDNVEGSDVTGPVASQQLEAAMPGILERVAEAARTNSDVTIDTAEFAAKLTETAVGDALMPHTRPSESARSFAEVEARAEDVKAMKAEADELLQEKRTTDKEFVESADRVEENLYQQLNATGVLTEKAMSRAVAQQYVSFVVVNAAQLKMTPEEFYKRYPYRVFAAEAQPRDSAAFDQTGDRRTDSPEFRNWFGDSKVVDEKGQPLVVYHGTASTFDTFSKQKAQDKEGRRLGMGWGAGKFYFASSGEAASSAAQFAEMTGRGKQPQVMPVYLSMRKPIDAGSYLARVAARVAKGATRDAAIAQTDREVRKEGYDGIVDHVSGGIAVFDPTQIKSVNNRGTYDPTDPNVLNQLGDSRVKTPTPAVRKLLKSLTPAEQRKITDKTAAKVIAQLKKLPSAKEMAAVAQGGVAKRGWYRESAAALEAVFGADAPRFAMLLAALSPQTSVEQNLTNALNVWKTWIDAGRPTGRDAIIDVMASSVQGKSRESVLEAWIPNSVRALTTDSPSGSLLSGPKVNSFFRNLIGDTTEVTLDAWMANYALVDQAMFGGSLTKSDSGKGTGYLAFSARVRETAALLTKETGKTWTPAEVQETIWSWAKTLYELQTGEASATQLLAEGKLTDELINSTPDFSNLFHEPNYATILNEAGYGAQLEILRGTRGSADVQLGQEAGSGSEAEATAGEARRRLQLQAAKRLERLREQRATASALRNGFEQLGLTDDESGDVGGGAAAGQSPVYGTAREGSTRVRAVHYSKQPRTFLNGAAYGTGLSGQERSRVAGDPILGQRIYFYVDAGTGITPEIGVGTVGHEVVLENVYDINEDPLGIIAEWKKQRAETGATLNDMELAIHTAGFDGYFVPAVGAAVLVGPQHTNVSVRQIGDTNGPQTDRSNQAPQGAVPDPSGVRGGSGVLDESFRQSPVDDAPLRGLPQTVRHAGEDVAFGPFRTAREAAARYMERAGLEYNPPRDYVQVDRARATRIAQAFEEMKHDPGSPEVQAAYDAMIDETIAQWQVIKETGLQVEFIDGPDPYQSPRDAILDVTQNNHLYVFPTTSGFGGSESANVDISGNPLLRVVEGEEISGRPVQANDIFRIVHDYFGHVKEGVGFRARGEENAWQQHMAMYSPLARKAATSETRGQNSWVNFGPFAESNQTANGADTQYAPQKIGLLPDWVVEEGYAGDALAAGERKKPQGTFSPRTLTALFYKKANISTVLHETAHYYLTVYADMAARPDATPMMRANMQTLLDWFGVKDLATWNALSIEQQRKHHEAFAYNYEVYAFEGKAPSKEMKTIFARFAEWLRVFYKDLLERRNRVYRREFGTDLPMLTKEVRQVMDRMLASEEAVALTYAQRDLLPVFQTQEESGFDDAKWAAYQAMWQEERDEAVAEVTRASLRNVQWLSGAEGKVAKALQARNKEERARIRREVVQEVQNNPRDRARRWLRKGEVVQPDGTVDVEPKGTPHKLDRATVVSMLPPGTDLKPLSGMLKNDGLHPDHVAEALGGEFKTGRALLDALIEMRPFEDIVNDRTDQRMLAEHAELVEGTPEWRDFVNRAVNSEARARFAAAEQRALQKATTPVRVLLDSAREAARLSLERSKVADVDPRKLTGTLDYITRNLHEAQRKGDTDSMIIWKRKQLLYHMLVAQAYEAKQEIASARDEFRKMFRSDKKLAKERNVDLVLAARWVLSKFGLTSELQAKASETALATAQENDPERLEDTKPLIDAAVAGAKPFDQLTLAEFRDLRNTVRYLWARSKRDMEIEVSGRKVKRSAAVAEMLVEMKKVLGEAPVETSPITDEARRSSRYASTFAKLTRIEHWARKMDGGTTGPVTTYLFRPLRERYDSYMVDRERLVKRIHEGLQKLTFSDAKIEATELIGAPVLNGTKQLLGAVQHAGNNSNLRKLLLGYGWTEDLGKGEFNRSRWDNFLTRMMAEGHLTKEHLDYLQMVWTLNEKELKPIAQKVNREVYGLFFEQIEATPFETPWGTYAGGYMPAKPDPDHPRNSDIRQREALDGIQAMESDFRNSMSGTARGFTISRNLSTRPLTLDIRLQSRHIDEVLRFVHMQPALRDVKGLLKDREFASYLNGVDPTAIKDMLIPWLEDVARNQVTKPSSMPALDKFFGFLRRSTGLNFMFASFRNAAQQITGLSNVLVYVKGRHVRDAMWRYYTSAPSTTNWVVERSKFMQSRLRDQVGQLHDDIDLLLDPSWMGNLKRWTNKHGYFAQRFMQNQVDVVAWLASYQQEMEKSGADVSDADAVAAAIAEADAVVRLTQGSVTSIDTAAYERSSAFARLFTQFSSYYNTVLNQITSAPPGSKARASLLGLVMPAFGAAVIAAVASGGAEFDDRDENGTMDEYLEWLFSTQARAGLATVPGFGPLLAQAASGDSRAGDRLTPAPAWSSLQALARSVSNLASGDPRGGGRQIYDAFTVFAVATGIPVGGLGRSIGYAVDVARGDVVPRHLADRIRGTLSGNAGFGTRR
jgi:hypothetical protein